jgi:hypothetical protein
MNLDLQERANNLLEGLKVKSVLKLTKQEIVVEFDDGTRLLVHSKSEIDVSIT